MKSEEVMRILENAIRIGKGVIRYGSVASYIPELAKADKNKLGICLYTIDGNQFETGNTEDRFTIQSIANYAQTECQFRYCGTAIPFLTV